MTPLQVATTKPHSLGHKMLYEKMEREFGEVHEELDALNSTQAAQEFVLTRRLKQV